MEETISKSDLDENKRKVLYAIHRAPGRSDADLAQIMGMKESTFTSVKNRLLSSNYYRIINFPLMNKLGSEIFGIILTNFTPIISLEERKKISQANIESSPEIFYSVGDPEKGFSFSICKNYTRFAEINEIRTRIFGKEELLEKEYPLEVIFPFKISEFRRFFDFSNALGKNFEIDPEILKDERWNLPNSTINSSSNSSTSASDSILISSSESGTSSNNSYLNNNNNDCGFCTHFEQLLSELSSDVSINLSLNEQTVLYRLIENPNETITKISELSDVSRHTVTRIRSKFIENGLLYQIAIPELRKLDFNLLALYHIQFNPHNPPLKEDLDNLMTPSTIFFSNKSFEAIILNVNKDYEEYKKEKTEMFVYLKSKDLVKEDPKVRRFLYDQLDIIKKIDMTGLTEKLLNIENRIFDLNKKLRKNRKIENF